MIALEEKEEEAKGTGRAAIPIGKGVNADELVVGDAGADQGVQLLILFEPGKKICPVDGSCRQLSACTAAESRCVLISHYRDWETDRKSVV